MGERISGGPVPGLDLRSASKKAAANDEVASILSGLQLDKQFFLGKMRKEFLEELLPEKPTSQDVGEAPGDSSISPRPRERQTQPQVTTSRSRVMKTKKEKFASNGSSGVASLPVTTTLVSERRRPDFDIYLNEALMPVLAQALDSLGRQVQRMKEQGDALDPKVRARFNPLTWLAQQLLRRHPRCTRTPRREALYQGFQEWADQERGRRELLRMKDIVQQVFNGFLLRGSVQRETIPSVINAIDDTLRLGGVLKGDPNMQRVMGTMTASPDRTLRRKSTWFKGDAWNFRYFWYQFAGVLVAHDVVPYSAIDKGIQALARELQEQRAAEEAKRREVEERQEREAEQRRQLSEYAVLYERLQADEVLNAILNQNKILSGDDVRPGDAGFDFEVPPKGQHVLLLSQLLRLLGFSLERRRSASNEFSAIPNEASWWTEDLAAAWTVLQEIHFAELADGVVEKEVLEQVLVPPVGFMLLKRKVEDAFESRAEARDGVSTKRGDERQGSISSTSNSKRKPSMEVLCRRLHMPMARMSWLHALFESFLHSDEDAAEGGPPPQCFYPDNPASIGKPEMRALMAEVLPGLGEAEYEARFRRLDEDGSNRIEFDEFVAWVHDDELRLVGAAERKPSFQELADLHGEPLEIIKYLHTCFQEQLPEGEVDEYPDKPAALPKAEAYKLLDILTSHVDAENFEADWEMVDPESQGSVDFDALLDILDFGELPAELRDRFS